MKIFTFEKDYFVVSGPLVHSVHTVQVGWEAPPEAMDLSRTKRHQVLLSGQSPEVLPYEQRDSLELIRLFSTKTKKLLFFMHILRGNSYRANVNE